MDLLLGYPLGVKREVEEDRFHIQVGSLLGAVVGPMCFKSSCSLNKEWANGLE